jgi:general secretion pathway protein I
MTARPITADGFTLIEVLAALAVLALAMGASLSAASFYSSSTRGLEDRMLAGWLAHNRMVETFLEPAWPATGRREDFAVLAEQEWEVEREVEETPDPFIRRVTIRVRHRSDDEGWLITRSAFLAEPAQPLANVPNTPNTPGQNTPSQTNGAPSGVSFGP